MTLHTEVGFQTGIYRVTRTAAGVRVDGHYVRAGEISATVSLVDDVADELEIAAHGLATGAGPLWLTTTGVLPGGLSSGIPYWVIDSTDDRIQLALSRADALAIVSIDITSAGSGTLTLENVFLASADVQPATGAHLEDLREGQRSSDIRTAYTDVQLMPRTVDFEPDVVEIGTERFRVDTVEHFTVISGHYRVRLEKETTP